MTRRLRILLFVGAALIVITYLGLTALDPLATVLRRADPRETRDFTGLVHGDGAPLANARVILYEDLAGGFEAEAVTDAEGRYRIRWTPRARGAADLMLLASDPSGRYASAVLPAGRAGADLFLVAPAPCEGLVLDANGDPLAGARIAAALRDGRDAHFAHSDAEGRFRLEGFAPRAPLHLVVRAEGFAPFLEGRFVAGDPLLVRLRRGMPLRLRLRDPAGRPVVDAVARLPGPPALAVALRLGEPDAYGDALLADGCARGNRLVAVDAPGYLRASVSVAPARPEEVILWPARELEVRAFDSRTRQPVDDFTMEIELVPEEGASAWHGEMFGNALREFPERPGARRGERIVRLPRCRLRLAFAAPGHADRTVVIDAEGRSLRVALAALGGPREATLRLRAEGHKGTLPLVVGEEESGWVRSFTLEDGHAEVSVPAGRTLQAASPGAAEGFWMPRIEIQPILAGQEREVPVSLRPAVRLEVVTEPAAEGRARVIDVGNEAVMRPIEATLHEGRAKFWVRPLRRQRIEIEPTSNHFPRNADVLTQQEDLTAPITMHAAAGFRAEVLDRAGRAVPFAQARFFGPDGTGRAQFGRPPLLGAADARGVLTVYGLGAGTGALEIAAPGFRTRWFAAIPLVEGRVEEAGGIPLDAVTLIEGMLVDAEGNPVAQAQVRVLAPRMARMQLGGGVELEVYDLTGEEEEESVSRADGSFELEDYSPRAPLLSVQPAGGSDLAPTPFVLQDRKGAYVLTGRAYLQLDLPSSAEGVYLVLGSGRAVKIQNDPPVAVRPLPVLVPSGKLDLLIVLRNGLWASALVNLKPGEHLQLAPRFAR